MRYPNIIQNLIDKFTTLPSVGPKTAERYVFHLLNKSQEELKNLADNIIQLKSQTTICHSCGAISEQNPCKICQDSNRNQHLLCIVENTQDYLAIEATQQYNGRYFILGGLINTVEDIGPQDLRIKELLDKLKKEDIKEIILALNFTVEGESTALYLNKLLEKYKTSRLAKGLPAGSNLEYVDPNTLASSFKNRKEI